MLTCKHNAYMCVDRTGLLLTNVTAFCVCQLAFVSPASLGLGRRRLEHYHYWLAFGRGGLKSFKSAVQNNSQASSLPSKRDCSPKRIKYSSLDTDQRAHRTAAATCVKSLVNALQMLSRGSCTRHAPCRYPLQTRHVWYVHSRALGVVELETSPAAQVGPCLPVGCPLSRFLPVFKPWHRRVCMFRRR